MMTYLRFLTRNARFLSLGFVLFMFSSFGQTYYIAIFGGDIRGAFSLSNGQFGGIYAVATLVSAGCLLPFGQLIDRFRLLPMALTVTCGLAVGCLLLASAPNVALLGLAIFLLRFAGQGMMPQLASVAVARRFDRERGRALGVAALGMQAGVASFPILGVALGAWLGWRGAWAAGAAILALGLTPVIWFLIGHSRRPGDREARGETGAKQDGATRLQVLRDARFYAVLPVLLATPFIHTGIILHQARLVEEKGWAMEGFAAGFALHAIAAAVAALLVGPAIDRFSAARLLPLVAIPIAVGSALLWGGTSLASGWAYLALGGVTVGIQEIVFGALWAELYGVRHLGAIKTMTTSLMVFSSAVAPGVMGWLIDAGVSLTDQAAGCALYAAAAAALVWFARAPATATR